MSDMTQLKILRYAKLPFAVALEWDGSAMPGPKKPAATFRYFSSSSETVDFASVWLKNRQSQCLKYRQDVLPCERGERQALSLSTAHPNRFLNLRTRNWRMHRADMKKLSIDHEILFIRR